MQGRVEYAPAQTASHAAPSGGRRAAAPSVPRQLAQLVPAPQTLVQPDLPNILLQKQVPVPLVLLWSPENTPVKKIVPLPQKPVTAVKVRPSIIRPNKELNLADLKISPTAFSTSAPAPLPSTTSPIVVRGQAQAKQVPQTAPKAAGKPAPGRVMSLSDLQLQEGTATIPPANETARAVSSLPLVSGSPKNNSQGENGSTANKQNGSGAGKNPGSGGNKETAAGGPAGQTGANTGGSQGADVGSGLSNEPSLIHIKLPEDGQFGVVVVGSSLAEEYPETLGIWSGRLAYTVYLHVGLPKNWILQYCMPRTAEASVAGNVNRPDAPWPYDIVRPHLAAGDLDADAVMVHGFVNTSGRFEHLAIVFPAQFPQTKFVLSALEQWRFRPALQNGQIATVEVLLIIPEEPE